MAECRSDIVIDYKSAQNELHRSSDDYSLPNKLHTARQKTGYSILARLVSYLVFFTMLVTTLVAVIAFSVATPVVVLFSSLAGRFQPDRTPHWTSRQLAQYAR